MSITVTTRLHETVYATAEKWVIDDEDRLHVVGPNGNLASYARGVWSFVTAGTLHETTAE